MDDDMDTALAPAEGGRWEFNAEVAAAFDDMLAKSIPNYEGMREMVTRAAFWHVEATRTSDLQPPRVVDLGASRGSALAPIIEMLGPCARYLAYDISEPMLDLCRKRFKDSGCDVTVGRHDLREGLPRETGGAAVFLSVLTLQFIPIEYRQRLLAQIACALRPGGALILVEKVLGANAHLDEMEVDIYYDVKRGQGYTQEAIDRKRLSLEGVLVPLTARFNEELLRDAGFAGVDCVWSWSNFRCWVAAAPRSRTVGL